MQVVNRDTMLLPALPFTARAGIAFTQLSSWRMENLAETSLNIRHSQSQRWRPLRGNRDEEAADERWLLSFWNGRR